MLAGTCVGAVPANGCQYSGWSPNWLPPRTDWDGIIAGLLNAPDEIVCPYCMIDRGRSANVPGFSNQKANRLRTMLNGLWCLRADGSRSPGHCHLFAFSAEDFSRSRNEPPAPGETDSG